ncbi:hypothetical protein ACVWZZ_001680 [Bradyrhizobium sp. LM6.10]
MLDALRLVAGIEALTGWKEGQFLGGMFQSAPIHHRHPEVRAMGREATHGEPRRMAGRLAASWPRILRGSARDACASQTSRLRMTELALTLAEKMVDAVCYFTAAPGTG